MPLGCKRIKECQHAPPAASGEYLQRKARRYGAEKHAWGLTHSSSTALSVSVSVAVYSVSVLSMPVFSVVVLLFVVLSVISLSVVILSVVVLSVMVLSVAPVLSAGLSAFSGRYRGPFWPQPANITDAAKRPAQTGPGHFFMSVPRTVVC